MSKILVTWVARNNDPYEWDAKKGELAVDKNGNKIDGPTLALLFHPDSFLCGQITDVVTLCRKSSKLLRPGEHTDSAVARELNRVIDQRTHHTINVHPIISWVSDDPTDHEGLFSFLKKNLPEIRMTNPLAEIYLHLSPGTPQMHAVMLLMVTSGFIIPSLKMIKTYRSTDGKKGSERFKEVLLDISPFYASYRNARPHLLASPELGANLMPDDFEKSGDMRAVYNRASKIAVTDTPVLITGEVGTGKYALASWIRLKSNSCNKADNTAWPAVSCGAHSTLDSFLQVLYGDKAKGYQGVLAIADGETLLFDEIDLLSDEAQRLLVQLLDHQKFRLIATSSLSLIELRKSLIDPLYQRLLLPPLELPSLRNVKDDIVFIWKGVFRDAVLKYVDKHQQDKVTKWGVIYCGNIVSLLKDRTLPGNLHDLNKIAVNIATSVSINDSHKDAKEIYQQAISEHDSKYVETVSHDLSTVISQAFASRKQLDDYLPVGELVGKGPLKIKGFEKELKKFVANEIRRLASELKCNIEALCDLDRKTVSEWRSLNRENDGSKSS
jgi:hypothetical protein